MTPPALDRDICIAGIPEWIDVRKSWMTEMPLPRITFVTTDAPGSWSLGGEAPGAVTVRGTASDVYLYMNGRLGTDLLEITGDVEALEAFTARMEYLNG